MRHYVVPHVVEQLSFPDDRADRRAVVLDGRWQHLVDQRFSRPFSRFFFRAAPARASVLPFAAAIGSPAD